MTTENEWFSWNVLSVDENDDITYHGKEPFELTSTFSTTDTGGDTFSESIYLLAYKDVDESDLTVRAPYISNLSSFRAEQSGTCEAESEFETQCGMRGSISQFIGTANVAFDITTVTQADIDGQMSNQQGDFFDHDIKFGSLSGGSTVDTINGTFEAYSEMISKFGETSFDDLGQGWTIPSNVYGAVCQIVFSHNIFETDGNPTKSLDATQTLTLKFQAVESSSMGVLFPGLSGPVFVFEALPIPASTLIDPDRGSWLNDLDA